MSFTVALFFGWFAAPVATPAAYVAHNQIRRTSQGGAALANAALAISHHNAALAVTVLILRLYVVAPG
jgi:hypothetical protein